MTHASQNLGHILDFVFVLYLQQPGLQVICNLEKTMDKYNGHRISIVFNKISLEEQLL